MRAPAEPRRPERRFASPALQPNIPQVVREDADLVAANYVKVIALAGRAAAARPDLILIPESSFYGIEWSRSPTLRRDLAAVSARGGSAILFNDVDEMPDGRYFNAARLLTPAGMAPATYHKVHLVPFGEYVPLPKLFFFMREISKIVGAFTAAKRPGASRGRRGLDRSRPSATR